MEARPLSERVESWLRVSAALLGTFLVALPATICLARFLPVAQDTRLAVAFGVAIPGWVALMCVAFAAKSGYRVWGACLALAAVFAAPAYLL